jgi:uncharacterized protein
MVEDKHTLAGCHQELILAMLALASMLLVGQQSKMVVLQCAFYVSPKIPKIVTKNLSDSYLKRHLETLEGHWKTGKIAAVGPFSDGGHYRGVAIFRAKDEAEVRELLKFDPMLRNGVMELEVLPWFAEDVFQKAEKFFDMREYLFGILERPDKAPSYDKATLEKLQAGHMANINKMAKDGLLVSAGPYMLEGKRRGVFIFDSNDRKKVEKACAEDAAIKAGRLGLRLMTWMTSKGTLRKFGG